MPRSPWLAIDAATPPAARARELRQEWERFLSGSAVTTVRAPVADSWRRSLAAGVDPSGHRAAPLVGGRSDATERWAAHPLRDAAELIRHCLGAIADESEHLIVISDAAGLLLKVEGDPRVRSRAADSMNFTEGGLWSESGVGTNAIGTAIAADHCVQIFAAEHFNEVVHPWTCSAAPIHDPETGGLLGVIDLTGLERTVHPFSLAAVMTTARAVEAHLRSLLDERDNRLRARARAPGAGNGERRALVSRTGRVVADDSRGWLSGSRVDVPPRGGELMVRSGERAYAEPVDGAGFVVRELGARRARRDGLRRLADEQTALRRLAGAVAHDESPAEVFRAVAEEMAPLVGADGAAMVRFEPDRTPTVVAGTGPDNFAAVMAVSRTGGTARKDQADRGSVVAGPIIVAGRLWGAMVAWTRCEPLPPDTGDRMAKFTELAGVVIANAQSRTELAASRARVVAAGDEARRRIQRDLHDGAQQRLVSAVLALKLARRELGDATGPVVDLVEDALSHAEGATGELRELAHGILPRALSTGGLRAAVEALVARLRLPVLTSVTGERLPEALEATAYFIVAEALTNTVRHARAGSAKVTAAVERGELCVEVSDDGVGGAATDAGSGLLGLRDRAAVANGGLSVHSPPGEGTVVTARLPLPISAKLP
jgi:signal transduction histidine kinase